MDVQKTPGALDGIRETLQSYLYCASRTSLRVDALEGMNNYGD